MRKTSSHALSAIPTTYKTPLEQNADYSLFFSKKVTIFLLKNTINKTNVSVKRWTTVGRVEGKVELAELAGIARNVCVVCVCLCVCCVAVERCVVKATHSHCLALPAALLSPLETTQGILEAYWVTLSMWTCNLTPVVCRTQGLYMKQNQNFIQPC